MNIEKSIHERIKEKRDKLIDTHAAIAIHMGKEITKEQQAKAVELQDRLEFRTLAYEEKLLDEKLEIYQQTLEILRD